LKILLDIVVLATIALGTWWLTGFDKTAGGESRRSHHLSRAIRCVLVVFFSGIFLWYLQAPGMDRSTISILIFVAFCIAITLCSPITEVFTHGFLRMADPAMYDDREFDPKQAQRHQDAIAKLIHSGRKDEAIKLCEELKESGEVDIATLQNTLEFLGVKQERPQAKPMAEVGRLRTQGKFAEAEQLLKSLLEKNPANDEAGIMLIRLYAQDLRQPTRAHEVLRELEKQPYINADRLEFARRSIDEWSQSKPAETPEPAGPPKLESLDELLDQGGFGTAVTLLEQHIKVQPKDFDLRLKLAEVYAVHCKYFPQAEKIIRQIELSPNFNPQQVALARTKLAEWNSAAGKQHGAM
jgi:tetratricopeptide (TPR) repeat protein